MSKVLSGRLQGIHQNQADASVNTPKNETFYTEKMLKAEKGLICLNYPYTCQAPYFPEEADNCEFKERFLKLKNKPQKPDRELSQKA